MKKERKPIAINPFVLIFCVVFICGLITFIITPGTLTDGVYTALPRNKINFDNFFNIFRAIPYGLKDSANIMILILVVGGALEIYKKTGAIDTGISAMINKFGASSQTMLLVVLITVFSAIGGFLGWIEVLIPFIPLVIAVVLALGYDSMTAVAVCVVGVMGGFMAGPTNLYTVGVSNGILQKIGILPEGSDVFVGLGFRITVWAVVTAVSILYIVIYANKARKDSRKSLVADIDVSDISIDAGNVSSDKMTTPQILVLLTILGAMILTVIGMKYGINGVQWSIDDVSAIFFLSGIIAGFIGKMKAGDISDAFITGAQSAIAGALIVGVARGVYWILEAGNINATIIYSTTELLKGTSPLIAAIGIVIIVSFINGLIPSGSGKGALLSPILVPIAVSLGLSSQTAVLAYQFGDGITNMFWFSYGTLLIFLNYGKVPINRWYKFIIPLLFIFFVIAFISLVIAINIGF
ncbi:AbgT family transporter [Irregularibacter muris]|uniref:AbgT family transporter n=1 Tax=Irregularibacter muris TaxID=1796619 RepID=A0AAE3HDZ5_9FIRM|nr:AbgT family transporter [Irregularibacter muris]MCR1898795.1 AbgT family transporter [Irregularibacter muris]